MGFPSRHRRVASPPVNGSRSRRGPRRGTGHLTCLARTPVGCGSWFEAGLQGLRAGGRRGSRSQGEERRGRRARAAQTRTVVATGSFLRLQPAKSWSRADAAAVSTPPALFPSRLGSPGARRREQLTGTQVAVRSFPRDDGSAITATLWVTGRPAGHIRPRCGFVHPGPHPRAVPSATVDTSSRQRKTGAAAPRTAGCGWTLPPGAEPRPVGQHGAWGQHTCGPRAVPQGSAGAEVQAPHPPAHGDRFAAPGPRTAPRRVASPFCRFFLRAVTLWTGRGSAHPDHRSFLIPLPWLLLILELPAVPGPLSHSRDSGTQHESGLSTPACLGLGKGTLVALPEATLSATLSPISGSAVSHWSQQPPCHLPVGGGH